ncbi:MAG: glycosyltransferase [Paludibacter sp.]|nr:glycosyltransferase [Paludibacter sp.]MDD4198388.1 glycosyltransferase [Paludibacter sp.]MDD4427066.1 glycosyltransferase [Paludibacter sp.]
MNNKIAFLSALSPFDIGNWSGTLYHIVSSLSKYNSIEWIGENIAYMSSKFYSKKEFYLEEYASVFGKIISEKINRQIYDVLIVRDYFLGAYLHVNIPIVYIGDTTFRLFKENLKIPSAKFEEIADDVERRMIENANSIIFSSDWAKESAICDYSCIENKIHVVEFGANIPHPEKWQHEIDTSVCNLVFIGRNWVKKGGEKVLGAYRKLKSEGFPCTLTIIGSVPLEMLENDKDLTIIPFLDKSKPEHLNKLCSILKDAHFLVLPTEFDAFGIVFCEASAYGVPSIAADVGGVSQSVREGKNGFLLPPTATAEDYAEKIKSVFSDKESYIKLRASSRNQYETRLNWDVWGEKVNKILEETVENYRRYGRSSVSQKEQEQSSVSETKKNNPEAEILLSDADFYLPVYVINLKNRIERRKHIEEQFHAKPEFELTWIDAVEHPIGAVGLWRSMVKAVQTAIEHDDDIMIICEDDHVFTPQYSKEYLLVNIIQANEQDSELLSGGIGGFGTAVPVAANRYWVDWFWCTQFIVVFKPLFQKILEYDFKYTDTADGVLSAIAKDKMTIYPFISIQKDFGYSDVTRANNEISGMITNHFQQTDYRLSVIHQVAHKFKKDVNNK